MKRILYFAVLYLICSSWVFADISARVDRTTLTLGDSVVLTLTARDARGQPDFSVLEQDFEIAARRQESRWSFVNGAMQQQASWILTLYPRQEGSLTIPAIQVGQDTSEAIALNVNEASQQQTEGKRGLDIIIEYALENKTPYVQQEAILKQRLLYAVPFQPGQASLSKPELIDGKGTLVQVGQMSVSKEERDGRQYDVIERRFSLIAHQSGEVEIGRSVFEGILVEDNNRNRNEPQGQYYAFPMGRSIRRYSRPLTVQVKPQPADYDGQYWLPARDIVIHTDFSKPVDQLKPGEPVQLTLAISAEGLMAEQLPALQLNPSVGLKAYSDKPELTNQEHDEGILGMRQDSWVLVANGGGEYVLPAISLDWWNVATQQKETTTLEATQFYVHGEANTNRQQGKPAIPLPDTEAGEDSAANLKPDPTQTLPESAEGEQEPASPPEKSWLMLIITAAIAVLIASLAALVLWWRHNERKRLAAENALAHPKNKSKKPASYPGRTALMMACKRHDLNAAHQALLVLARDEMGLKPPFLHSLRHATGPAMTEALDELEHAMYSTQDQGQRITQWDGRKLLKIIEELPVQQLKKDQQRDELEPMYPN